MRIPRRALRYLALAAGLLLNIAVLAQSEPAKPAPKTESSASKALAPSIPPTRPWLDVEPLGTDQRGACPPGNGANVLAIDGGGVRGIIPASILAYLEARTGLASAELFDLIAGVSTGSIIAVALAKPDANGRPAIPARRIAEDYINDVRRLFPSGVIPALAGTEGLLRPKYRPQVLGDLLRERFGDLPLSGLLGHVLVPTYDLRTNRAWVLRSRQAREDPGADFLIRELILASTAAPMFYPPMRLGNVRGEEVLFGVDAGLFINNPTALAEAEAEALWPGRRLNLLSLGTGVQSAPVVDLESEFGLLDWIPGVFAVSAYGQESVATLETMRQLRERRAEGHRHLWRLNPALSKDSVNQFDASPEHMALLLAHAAQVIDERRGEIDEMVHLLLCAKGR